MRRSCRHRRWRHERSPSWLPPSSSRGSRGAFGGTWGSGGAAGALRGDELLQPADLAFAGLQTVALQLEGVRVETLGGPGEHVPKALPALLDLAAASLEDAQPG